MLSHLLEGVLELLKSELELGLSSVGFVPLSNVFHEHNFLLRDYVGEESVDGDESESGKGSVFHLFNFKEL